MTTKCDTYFLKGLFWFCLLMLGSTRLLANITDEQGKSYNEESKSQKSIPLVYKCENSSGHHTDVVISDPSALSSNNLLPDPLEWADGNGRVEHFSDWKKRRNEILRELQYYEIGEKPVVKFSQIKAAIDGQKFSVEVTVNDKTLTLSTEIFYPKTGKAPYPLMIGTSNNSLPSSIFTERGIALMTFHEAQVNNYSQFGKPSGRGNYEFDKLYPSLVSNGAYADWAWGLSRLIDGLQQLGSKRTKIDLQHIGVTGCSYAGKMALFCGALDERIALTIAQESGGGGAAAWRVSRSLEKVEGLDQTDGNWFKTGFKENFGGENLYRLPYDHHELCALVCPRALLILGNPDYQWLADPSGYVSSCAARKVWDNFGIADRMGYSIVGGHRHCQLPETQYSEVIAFVEKFLLGRSEVNTEVQRAPSNYANDYDCLKWIKPE